MLTGQVAVDHHKQPRKLHPDHNLRRNGKVFTFCVDNKSNSKIEKFHQRKSGNTNRDYIKWSAEEKEAMNRQFSSFVEKMQCPKQLDCLNAKAKEPALSNRTWKKIKFYVSTQINKFKFKIRHKP